MLPVKSSAGQAETGGETSCNSSSMQHSYSTGDMVASMQHSYSTGNMVVSMQHSYSTVDMIEIILTQHEDLSNAQV